MAIAYVLSKNTYPDPFQANLIGVDQGTQIVYTTTSTLTSANVLYADSRLTQPIYGDGTSWYGVQLLTNTSVVYPITISSNGTIAIGSGTTTSTTTAAPTTTTTAAPTTTTTTGVTYTIGQAAFGGIIAYINGGGSTGTSGLVATTNNVSVGAAWGCDGTSISGADGIAIGTGNQNTIDILAECSESEIAARLCGDLNQGGYSDWFLPSKDELNALYVNKSAIGGFSNGFYHSSTQNNINSNWSQDFTDGAQYTFGKSNLFFVRAVRSF